MTAQKYWHWYRPVIFGDKDMLEDIKTNIKNEMVECYWGLFCLLIVIAGYLDFYESDITAIWFLTGFIFCLLQLLQYKFRGIKWCITIHILLTVAYACLAKIAGRLYP
ncbi:MAG: hypothetical protein LBV07_02605 [Syntrophobacterales bacterium]|nr:hypothetical protein [Syntrophobacterales bacterium]